MAILFNNSYTRMALFLKILTLNVPTFKIKFIDSLSFIPMRLADFPKTFGIDELAKGYFPHLFNRKEKTKITLDPHLLHRITNQTE